MAMTRRFCLIADDEEVARLIAHSDWMQETSDGSMKFKEGVVAEGAVPNLSNPQTVQAMRQIMLERFPNAEITRWRFLDQEMYAVTGLAMIFGVGRSEAAAIAAAMERPLH